MVNIKEDYRLLAGIFLSSGSATNEPLEEAYAVPELEEEIPISPYEYRPTKRAGTYPVYRSYRSRRIAKLQRIPKIRGWQIPEVYHAPSHTSPVYKFVHKLHDDQSLEMSDVDVWEFESTQQQIPQGQLFSTVEMESRAAPDDPLTRRIFRVHFLQEALDALDSLSKHAKTQRAADYANVLFKAMRVIRDTLRHDPFSAVIIALHDALAYKNRWAEYTTAQYQQARDVLVKYGNQDLPANKALKAISSLETIGFDTTPFEAFTELEDNNSKASEGD